MKTYTFAEYRQLQEMSKIDLFLGELKKNKKEYAKLVFILAISIPKSAYATSNDLGLSSVAWEIIGMVLSFGKYACLGMGTKAMIETMLAGGNVKESTGSGIQYFIFYIVLNVYPKLFSMVKF